MTSGNFHIMLVVAATWLSLGWLGTYIGIKALRRRYGKEIVSNDSLWVLVVLGPFNLLGMMLAVKPWDRSDDL